MTPQGTLAEKIRAGGAGIPAFYTPAGVGHQLLKEKKYEYLMGKNMYLEEALKADFALVRAWKADKMGNLIYNKTHKTLIR